MSVILEQKEYEQLLKKSKQFDEISEKVDSFYSDGEDDDEIGLDDIGEYIAYYFGWL